MEDETAAGYKILAEYETRRATPRRARRTPSGQGRALALVVLVAIVVVMVVVGVSVGAAGNETGESGATVPVSLLPLSTVLPAEGGGVEGRPIIQTPTVDVPQVTSSTSP